MTLPRKQLICTESTPYYHVTSRCVRRAFICGYDKYAQRSYEHRKPWVVDKAKQLAGIFTIDICAYAIMSNHYHLVLHVNIPENKLLTDIEVISRWQQLFSLPLLIEDWLADRRQDSAQLATVADIIQVWRRRLSDISWFMRCLNEDISRRANKEDKCKGHFWEARFKSQALLDEKALLTCMAYVDLNPIRAGMCDSVEDQAFTSIVERIKQWKQQNNSVTKSTLLPFERQFNQTHPVSIPYYLEEYLHLVDWTGRAIRDDKVGHISENQPKLFTSLGIDSETWLHLVKDFSRWFGSAAGSWEALTKHSQRTGHCWCKGHAASDKLSGAG
jgi:REP element-mobilizing transposase RayT